MEYRPLGRTGVHVSKLCLGTMMFGAWGNPDHDDSIRIIHRALGCRDQLRRHRRRLLGRRVRGDRRQGARRAAATTSCWPPSSACRWARTPTSRGGSRRWIIAEVENSLRRLGTDWIDLYQMHRPDPDTDIDETLGALTDLVHQGKVRYIGSSSFSAGEIVEAQWAARDRRLERFRTEQPPYSILVRGIELDVLPTARGTAWASSPTARWPAAGCREAGAPTAHRPRRRGSGSSRASTCRCPRTSASSKPSSSSRRLADEAGVSLIELAIAFVVNHPAVTSAIIGPRTMEQLDSQLPAAEVALDPAILDRIDEIVQPGVNLNPADTSYGEQVLEPSLRRR